MRGDLKGVELCSIANKTHWLRSVVKGVLAFAHSRKRLREDQQAID
jgi:hypothetical protein